MIIGRYLIRESILYGSAATSILLLTFLSNQISRYLNQIASGKFAGYLLLNLVILELPRFSSLLLPAGVFLGVLLAYGRLYVQNEMTIITMEGGSKILARYPLILASIITLITGVLCLSINPYLLKYRNNLLTQVGSITELYRTLPARFQITKGGEQIFYVEKISKDKQRMQQIFSATLTNKKNKFGAPVWAISLAQEGYQVMVDSSVYLVMLKGKRYQITPGEKNLQAIEYQEYGIHMEDHLSTPAPQHEALSLAQLWQAAKNNNLNSIGELHWRLAIPLSVILLTLLAIPLSYVPVRQSRYINLLPGSLIYIVYMNMLIIGRNWLQQGTIATWLGLWWVHALLIIAIIVTAIIRRRILRF